MMLGNDYAGDCIYVRAGDNDIIIDAGSRANSIDDIQNYINTYVTDGVLEYVIVTHSDQDHIAGFAASESIFDLYECEVIIDFPLSNKSETTGAGNRSLYGKYIDERNAEITAGAKHYNALDCYNNQNGGQRVYELTEDGNVKMEILYNYFYDHKATDENDYSVCVQFVHGSRKFLFTGDLEEKGEEYLVQYNDLSQVELFKAGHHGSPTSSNNHLLDIIKPKVSVVCCCAGSVEYTQNFANTFPLQAFIDRIAPYTDKVYVPIYINVEFSTEKDKYVNVEQTGLLNGNIQVISDAETGVTVIGSNNDTKLKDTEWFKNNRITPNAWKN
jgi:competence protein ComEC